MVPHRDLARSAPWIGLLSQAEPAEGERKRLLEVRTGSQCQLSANMRLRGAFGALPTVSQAAVSLSWKLFVTYSAIVISS